MPIVHSLDKVTEWVQENVCNKVQLKLPAEPETPEGPGYDYKLVHPAAFQLFVPTKDRLPPKAIAPIPSVCLRIMQGSDDLIKSARSMKIQLCFSTWDPGRHGPDIIKPDENNPGKFIRELNEVAKQFYERSGDGWRDAWNMVDFALREIENAEYIAGLRVKKEEKIEFGPLVEQDAIPDYYPLWFAWLEFQLHEDIERTQQTYQHLL